MIGTRLGSYEVVAKLGAGGMGEVYRARDTSLDRDVALKVLPETFSADPDRRLRFEREAKLLATLNHPNIAQVFGAGVASHAFIAMELVDGEDLSAHIRRGALVLEQALAIARQLGAALEAAHEQGVIHRDLKPANIKIREDGVVKVLDFGLAKAFSAEATESGGGSGGMNDSPTQTASSTRIGMILGTAAYMAPEQAKGRVVDRRADVWAFGVVLFEMLAGRRAFDGDDVSDVLAAVLKTEPDWTALPADLPRPVRRLIERCLEKDPRKRLRDIGEGLIQMDEAFAAGASSTAISASTATQSVWWSRPIFVAAVTAIVVGSAAYAATALRTSATPPRETVRFGFMPTPPLNVAPVPPDFAIAPDGRSIVLSLTGAQRSPTLYMRRLDQEDLVLIRGTEGAVGPVFSPDGRWIAFVDVSDRSTLKKVPVGGGSATVIGRVPSLSAGMAWLADGTIVLGTQRAPLMRVNENGGTPTQVVEADPKNPIAEHLWPTVVPGTNVILFTINESANRQPVAGAQLAAIDLSTKKIVRSKIHGGRPLYVSTGHVLFPLADGSVQAVSFDSQTMAFSDERVPVLEGVGVKPSGAANMSVSASGVLVYSAGVLSAAARTLVWVDRTGKETPIPAPTRNYFYARVSPDGKRLSLDVRDQEEDIWIWDLTRETMSRLTDKEGPDQYGIWTPVGGQILFSSNAAGRTEIFAHRPDGVGTPVQITDTTAENFVAFPNAVTVDGKQVILRGVVHKGEVNMLNDLFIADIKGDRKVRTLLSTPHDELNAALSPDGKYMVFESNQSGSSEVYVRPFPDVNSRQWTVSTAGGGEAQWSRTGNEIYYVSPDGKVMAVKVTTSPAFELAKPVPLFDAKAYFFGGLGRNYDVAKDGRFVMVKNGPATTTAAGVNVVVGWIDEIRGKLREKEH